MRKSTAVDRALQSGADGRRSGTVVPHLTKPKLTGFQSGATSNAVGIPKASVSTSTVPNTV